MISAQFEACLLACERSYEMCSKHAAEHAPCRMISDATHRCADMRRQILGALRA